jgi:hypothetical protein
MPDLVQTNLHEILVEHARGLTHDPASLEGLLLDHCSGQRWEVSAGLSALRERVPDRLEKRLADISPPVIGLYLGGLGGYTRAAA